MRLKNIEHASQLKMIKHAKKQKNHKRYFETKKIYKSVGNRINNKRWLETKAIMKYNWRQNKMTDTFASKMVGRRIYYR